MSLIDKSALVAEIEKRIEEIKGMQPKFDQFWVGELCAFKSVLKILDIIEVKEVDLEKELEFWRHNHFHGRRDKEASGEYLERVSQLEFAKHLFKLGLQVNNPVTSADRGHAEEIIFNLKKVEEDYNLDLTKEIEWLRNKVQKGK